MNKTDHQMLIEDTFQEIIALTWTKGEEYSNSADQHANFKRLSQRLGLTPEQVLLVYLTKHMDSIDSYVKNAKNPGTNPSEPIEGRINDAILYLLLFKGLIQERTRLQEQASLVADRPSRARTEARGQERELRPGFESGDKRSGLLDRSEVLQDCAKNPGIDTTLYHGTTGVVDSTGGEGRGKGVPAGRFTGDGTSTDVLSVGGTPGSTHGRDDQTGYEV